VAAAPAGAAQLGTPAHAGTPRWRGPREDIGGMRRFCLGLLTGFIVGCTTRIAQPHVSHHHRRP